MNLKNARPVPKKEVLDFINEQIPNSNLYDLKSIPIFCDDYFHWIKDSKAVNLSGLEKFESKSYTHGTAQAFDFFYNKYHNRRMRCFKGDFIYHKLCWKQNMEWKYLEDDDLKENDAVILSVPFSDSGGIHPQTDELLDKCDELKVPVIIDSAYMIIANKINFNFDRDCIESVCFSLSKGFYGAEKLRIGLRLSKKFTDDGIEVFNLMEMVNMVGVYVGHQIIKCFPHDYNVNTFRSRQSDFCYSMNLKRSNCVIFGLADKDDLEYKEHDRGTDFRRVCLSPLLGDMEDLHYV